MILLGTSGWTYEHWDGRFYPSGLPARRRLEHYAAHFRTVELNASYYRWPRDATFAGWNRRLPDGFELAVKAPRGLTHGKRLREPERWVEIIERSLHEVRDRRGPLLLQLPPDFERDDARLDWALRCFADWVRPAVELRHPSWDCAEVYSILERHGASYVVMSGANLPCLLRATSEVVYVRWHGPSHDHLYAGSYSEDDLRWWADRLREWESAGHRVYGYFNNDGDAHAVVNCLRLRELLDS